jgi:hypothetical protein
VTGKKIEHWEFLLQLATQLSGIYSIDTPVIVQRKCWEHKPTHRIIYNPPMPSKLSSFVFSHQTNIKINSFFMIILFNIISLNLIYISFIKESKTRPRCIVCKRKGIDSKTPYSCLECQVYLFILLVLTNEKIVNQFICISFIE